MMCTPIAIDIPGRSQPLSMFIREGKEYHGSDAIVVREAFVENTYGLHEDQFKYSGIFVDIGANIGAVSLLAYTMGAQKIIAYEPDPTNYRMLMMNIDVNIEAPIEPYRKAVWSKEQTILLRQYLSGSTSNPEVVAMFPDEVISVPAVSLAQVLQSYHTVDVLKVDTEGAEYEILCDPQTNKKARMIMLEFHKTTKEKFGNLLATLTMTHNIQAFGHYDMNGGQIVCRRYE